MDIKKIFNKKKGKTNQEEVVSNNRNKSNSKANNDITDTCTSNDTNMIPGRPVNCERSSEFPFGFEDTFDASLNLDNSTDLHTISKSFQYSYNSNTNSLFSSKRTMSSGISSQPSSALSYSKGTNSNVNANEQSKIKSIGRPLRVLHEDEREENYPLQNANSFTTRGDPLFIDEDLNNLTKSSTNNVSISSTPTNQFGRQSSISKNGNTIYRRSNYSDDISICPTEKSASSNQISTPSLNTENVNFSKSLIQDSDLKTQLNEFIINQLRILSNSISNIMIEISQSVLNLTKASIKITESINYACKIVQSNKYISLLSENQFTTNNCFPLRKLIKNILYLLDNLLIGDVFNKSKALIVKSLHDVFVLIKMLPSGTPQITNFISSMSPKMFPITQNTYNVEKVDHIMSNILWKEKERIISDQEGAFIAPVLRGFHSPELSIITFVFGFPSISKEHQNVIKYFSTKSNDIHYVIQKNQIKTSSSKSLKLKSPFRTIEENQEYVPISMSLSTDSSSITSGTLGGYLYPKVPINHSNPKLLKYRGQIFGITCAHVVLGNENGKNPNNKHPSVSVPSPVLINLYKNALINQMMNHSSTSPEYKVYNEAVKMIDTEYPVKPVTINGKKVPRNLPNENLGNIIWGERAINDNRLTDLAIIKINENLKKKFVNYLGDDLQLSQYDPALILSNLNIKRKVSLQPRKNGILNTANLEVFKVGSTTGYTRGNLNGMKMIYWSDGSLRSSEFIISTTDGKSEGFANGGDSGAWILSKLSDVNYLASYGNEAGEDGSMDNDCIDEDESEGEDDNTKNSLAAFIESFIPRVSNNNNKKQEKSKKRKSKNGFQNKAEEGGLGVLGMLHSYDGEFKQFGLFTPMDDILERLEDVTGIEWGVVGLSEGGDSEVTSSTSISSSCNIDSEESDDEVS